MLVEQVAGDEGGKQLLLCQQAQEVAGMGAAGNLKVQAQHEAPASEADKIILGADLFQSSLDITAEAVNMLEDFAVIGSKLFQGCQACITGQGTAGKG